MGEGGEGHSYHVEGPKAEQVREPTVELSLVRGIWRLRVPEAERRVLHEMGFFRQLLREGDRKRKQVKKRRQFGRCKVDIAAAKLPLIFATAKVKFHNCRCKCIFAALSTDLYMNGAL